MALASYGARPSDTKSTDARPQLASTVAAMVFVDPQVRSKKWCGLLLRSLSVRLLCAHPDHAGKPCSVALCVHFDNGVSFCGRSLCACSVLHPGDAGRAFSVAPLGDCSMLHLAPPC